MKTNEMNITNDKTENVFVLVDSSMDECGSSVFRNRDTLLESAKDSYGLTDDELETLDLEGVLELGESTLFINYTTLV